MSRLRMIPRKPHQSVVRRGELITKKGGIEPPDPAPPVNTLLPVISPASGEVGDTFSCTTGNWSGWPRPTYAYQWTLDGGDIAGATSSTYQAAATGNLACKVTATNSEGSATATAVSVPVSEVTTEPPVITGVPTIDNTLPVVGDELTATPAPVTGNPTPTRSWQWFRGATPIGGATSQSYTVQAADEGFTLAVQQIETNSEGSDDATSLPTDPVTAPVADPYAIDGISPEAVADFANATPYYRKGGVDTTFTGLLSHARGSDATFVGSNGFLQTAVTDVPRLGSYVYNGSTWELAGLRFEPTGATNYILESEDLTDPVWQGAKLAPVISDFAIGPDGVLSLDNVEDNSSGDFRQISNTSISLPVSESYTATVFVEKDNDETRFPEFAYSVNGPIMAWHVNTKTGASAVRAEVGSPLNPEITVEDYSATLWRVIMHIESKASPDGSKLDILPALGTVLGVVDLSATGSINCGFVQIEQSRLPTSYIKASGGTASRAAEVLDIPATNTTLSGPNYSGTHDLRVSRLAGEVVTLVDIRADANNRITVLANASNQIVLEHVVSGALTTVTGGAIGNGLDVPVKIAWRASATDANIAVDGVAATAQSTTGAPDLSAADIVYGGMTYKALDRVFENDALTDAQLVTGSS